MSQDAGVDIDYDVVAVGAGFAGMYLIHKLRALGFGVRVYERGSGVGGTWYWNRYPGARCDIESMDYSYSFSPELEQEWEWSERFATQPEILRYANHVADRFDLRRDIRFGTSVAGAAYDEDRRVWAVTTDRGERVTARFFVMATGCLSTSKLPEVDGVASFAGATYHTGRWPHEGVDFAGQRVGVIGTGSSAIQAIPVIARQAAHLTVFQRTAQYSLPAHNRPLGPEQDEVKADYTGLRERNRKMTGGYGSRFGVPEHSIFELSDDERQAELERWWAIGGPYFLRAFTDVFLDQRANDLAAEFVRGKIRATVRDPEVAALLSPTTTIGCKRICIDTGYFETYNLPHVRLVDISRDPVELTPTGVRTGGVDHELDAVVFATGFDAMTGTLLRVDIRGRGGRTLRDAWAAGPRTYLGLQVPGFPNLFTITGPGSPSVLSNMIASIEQHVDWITACITHLRDNGVATIEADEEPADQWVLHVNAVADATLYPTCNSWYLGANIPGKPRVFMPLPGVPGYARICDDVAADGYRGFVLTPA